MGSVAVPASDEGIFSSDSSGWFMVKGTILSVTESYVLQRMPIGKNLSTFPLSKDVIGAVFTIGFSPDSQKLLAGLDGGLVKVWDFSGRVQEVTLRHDPQVNGLALLPDGRTLVSASRDIRFWDLNSSTNRMVLQPRSVMFRSVAISTNGRRLCVGAADGLVTIWDLASKQEVATLAGNSRPILGLSFLPDGNTLVSISVDEVRVWRAASLKEVDTPGDSR